MSAFTHHPREEDGWRFDDTRTYSQDKAWCKPVGFWLSVDDDWRRWSKEEEVGYADSQPTHFAVETARCLWLKSVEDIDRFHAEYVGTQDAYRINWVPLTQQYAGIIIAPYQWERRLSGPASDWYYPWDCASACIWDLSAIRVRATASQ